MDYTRVLQPLFDYLWYLIPFFIFAAVIKSPWFKGKAGEGVVNFSAKLSLDKTRSQLIKNVTLLREYGSTQIEHIIVSRYVAFVVETKSMKGGIFGGATLRWWVERFVDDYFDLRGLYEDI